jgi:hypothetical protein
VYTYKKVRPSLDVSLECPYVASIIPEVLFENVASAGGAARAVEMRFTWNLGFRIPGFTEQALSRYAIPGTWDVAIP